MSGDSSSSAAAAASASTLNLPVIIVGAGISGLVAAYELQKRHKIPIKVLEARDRVGGRTSTLKLYPKNSRNELIFKNGILFDEGGQWVGKTQKYVLELAQRYNIKTNPQRYQGKTVWDVDGRIMDGSKASLSFEFIRSIPFLLELHFLVSKIESLVNKVDLNNPTGSPEAKEWDKTNCMTWIRENVSRPANIQLFEAAVRGVHGVEAHELSMLQFLIYAKQSKSLANLINIENGNQELKFVGGAMQISQRLMEDIGKENVVFNTCVTSIELLDDRVVVKTNQETYHGSRVIVAMAPAIANKILYYPPLPREREQIMQRSFMGSIIKCLCLYEKKFWVDKGFSGEVVHDMSHGPVFNVFDDSRIDPETGIEQPALVGFINGEAAKFWSAATPEERKKAVTKQFSKWFGEEALNPILYFDKDWTADLYSKGCPVSTFATGTLTAPYLYSALSAPIKNLLFWAGTETAIVSQGFMDGAVQSGIRVADQIASKKKAKSKL